MTISGSEEDFRTAAQRLDALVQEFENLPLPEIRAKALEMLQAVDTLHRTGLGRLIAFIHEQGHAELVLRAAHDPVVHTLLLLYDFIQGEEGAPVESDRASAAPAGFVTLAELMAALPPSAPLARGARRPNLQPVVPTEEVTLGTMRKFEVDGVHVLIGNVENEWYAVRNACPAGGAPLHLGTFTPPVVVCPWHNEPYDIRTGRRVDGEAGLGLAVLPIAVVDGIIQLAVGVTP